jgi:hypothetical protein
MKRLLLLLSFFGFLQSGLKAQTQNPVKWQAAYKAINATEGEFIITAEIDPQWHTYSQRKTDAGPIPTSFQFVANKNYYVNGNTEETGAHEEFVKAFDAKIFVFTGKAEFKQKIKRNNKTPFSVSIKVEFMCCNDVMCLPPKTETLTVNVP